MPNTSDRAFRRAIWERDGGVCGFCGQPVPLEKMHLDHAVPRSLGGPTHELNLRPAHPRCNLRANNRLPRHGQMPLSVDGLDEETRLSVRVEPAVKRTLERVARQEHRTLTGQVEYILTNWLELKGIALESSS